MREKPNRALPSVGTTTDHLLYVLERSYSREPTSIRTQFKQVDDMRSYNAKILLSFTISGGVLGAGGLAILITIWCLYCKKKRADKDDYVFYENKEEE